jgi:integrase
MAEGRKYDAKNRRTGGLKPLREGVWRVDLELPRAPDEPRRRVSRTVEGSKEDAEAALEQLRRDVQNAGKQDPAPKRSRKREQSRRRGSGGITQVAHDKWLVGIEGERDPVTGARQRHTRTVQGTRKDAEAVLARLRLDFGSGEVQIATGARTVRAACDMYLNEVKTEKSTIRTDRSACNRVCSTLLAGGGELGNVPLKKVDWKLIEYVFEVWGRSLHPQTSARYASTLSKVFDHAKRAGWVLRNPVLEARRPRVPTHKPDVPKRQAVQEALEAAKKSDPMLHAYVLGLASIGCRRGELLALQVQDLDLEDRVVTIRAAISDGGPGFGIYYKPTKRADWRDVPITEQMAEVLGGLVGARQLAAGGVELDPESFVFTESVDGSTWLRPDSTSQRWLAARGKSKVTFAMLRRFVATELLDVTEGDYRTVASITGNSEETLRRWYDAGPNLQKKQAVVNRSRL